MKQTKKTLSDRELRQALAGLREDVAAPADFRAKLMQRLEREGIVQGAVPVRASEPSLLRRLAAFLTPARLGLAASAALALVLVLRFTATPKAVAPTAEAEVPQPQPQASGLRGREEGTPKNFGTSGQVLVASKKAKKTSELAALVGPKSESLPEALLGDEQSQTVAAAPAAVGDQAAAAPSTGTHMASAPVAAEAKPTYVMVEPTATPVTKSLDGNSQLRGNVVRASQGEAAVLMYRVERPGHVHVEIFNRLGESVAVLRDADQGPGVYDLRWAGGADKGGMAATGIYVMQVQAPGYQVQHKLLLVK